MWELEQTKLSNGNKMRITVSLNHFYSNWIRRFKAYIRLACLSGKIQKNDLIQIAIPNVYVQNWSSDSLSFKDIHITQVKEKQIFFHCFNWMWKIGMPSRFEESNDQFCTCVEEAI